MNNAWKVSWRGGLSKKKLKYPPCSELSRVLRIGATNSHSFIWCQDWTTKGGFQRGSPKTKNAFWVSSIKSIRSGVSVGWTCVTQNITRSTRPFAGELSKKEGVCPLQLVVLLWRIYLWGQSGFTGQGIPRPTMWIVSELATSSKEFTLNSLALTFRL